MLLIIDNYDSFTYNLVQYLGELGEEVVVYRNDAIDITEIKKLKPERIVISPGPCTPKEAGVSVEIIKRISPKIPTLGVCLGHQCIAVAFGGEVVRADRVVHGKPSTIRHNGKTIYEGVPNPFTAGRYNSLLVKRDNLPSCLEITAETSDDKVMGIRHKKYPIEGVQFHPESIMTPAGKEILRNFLRISSVSETNVSNLVV